jgi:hypothetical protein
MQIVAGNIIVGNTGKTRGIVKSSMACYAIFENIGGSNTSQKK